jgi:hypothetical protein
MVLVYDAVSSALRRLATMIVLPSDLVACEFFQTAPSDSRGTATSFRRS